MVEKTFPFLEIPPQDYEHTLKHITHHVLPQQRLVLALTAIDITSYIFCHIVCNNDKLQHSG